MPIKPENGRLIGLNLFNVVMGFIGRIRVQGMDPFEFKIKKLVSAGGPQDEGLHSRGTA